MDDVLTFTEEGQKIRIAPLSVYAVLKEVPEIRRFQVLAYPGNVLELRLEEKTGSSKEAVFGKAKTSLETYLAAQHVNHVQITLSEDLPRQNPNSGKFKHIVNMEGDDTGKT